MAEKRDNNGVLFKNKDKDETHPNWPDYNGNATVNGVDYWISAWVKTAESGKKFLSIAFKDKDAKTSSSASNQQPTGAEDLPF